MPRRSSTPAVLAPSYAAADVAATGIVAAGSGQVRVPPDSVRIMVGVEAQAKTVEEVQKQITDKMERVLASLRALGIPNLELQTTILSVLPAYATTPDGGRTPQIAGYNASNTVSATVRKAPVDKVADYASAIMGTALKTGANVTSGLELFLDDPSLARAQALENAVRDARRNGEVIAKAAGVAITGIATVSEREATLPGLRQAPQFGVGALGYGAPVESGEIVVTSNVTVKLTAR